MSNEMDAGLGSVLGLNIGRIELMPKQSQSESLGDIKAEALRLAGKLVTDGLRL